MRILLLVAAAATTAVLVAADAPAPKVEDVAKNYAETLTRLTEKPKSIGAELAMSCRSQPIDRTAGPHARAYANYFRNALAQQAGEKFAEGSVIVKEKISAGGLDGLGKKPEAVAGMIKRAVGTNPKSGDWEFFWAEGGKITTTGMQGCAGCHSGAKKDYVFTDAAR